MWLRLESCQQKTVIMLIITVIIIRVKMWSTAVLITLYKHIVYALIAFLSYYNVHVLVHQKIGLKMLETQWMMVGFQNVLGMLVYGSQNVLSKQTF